ncbi:hypothetical protein GCM10020255_080310 [Rhodococcus baikonurensis]
MAVQTLKDLLDAGVEGRTVLVRSDLNVPLDGGEITDPGRIVASAPTLRALAEGGAKVIVTAHLGRPDGQPDPKFSSHRLPRSWPKSSVATCNSPVTSWDRTRWLVPKDSPMVTS